jgi:hypothetical protein
MIFVSASHPVLFRRRLVPLASPPRCAGDRPDIRRLPAQCDGRAGGPRRSPLTRAAALRVRGAGSVCGSGNTTPDAAAAEAMRAALADAPGTTARSWSVDGAKGRGTDAPRRRAWSGPPSTVTRSTSRRSAGVARSSASKGLPGTLATIAYRPRPGSYGAACCSFYIGQARRRVPGRWHGDFSPEENLLFAAPGGRL